MSKEFVKQDINFMEYPLWFQDKYLAEKQDDGYVWKDMGGYVYRTSYKPPVKTDILYLYYLLLRSQKENWKDELTLTRYEIIKDCKLTHVPYWYNRLEDSLNRWLSVTVHFQGKFYNGKEYISINFGIIDAWSLEKETKKLIIRFSPEWLLKIKESNFFKMIDFEKVKTLRSPLVIRLYEILIKSFLCRNIWEIDSMKLAQKIPMKENCPADVIPRVKAAVNRINDQTNLKIKLTIKRPKRGKAIFVFENISNNNKEKILPTAGLPGDNNFQTIIKLIPPEHQNKKTIVEAISKACQNHGCDYAARNIKYTNKCCNGKNYRAYLIKALKEDWGVGLQEDEEVKQKIQEENERKLQQKKETLKRKKKFEFKIKEYIKNLSSDELETLRREAINHLDPQIRKNSSNFGISEMLVKLQMEEIIGERLKASESV